MSTESQLTSYSTTLISNHSAKKATHSVYIDFKKAFDTVSFNKLACKLISYGVKGRLLDWIVSFLTDRTQRVNVNGVLSQERTVLSGVPQGSVLGPLLFLLFINDIGDEFKSDFLLYADDLKLFSTNPTTIVSDLKLLSIWCDKWQMSVAPNKYPFLNTAQWCLTLFSRNRLSALNLFRNRSYIEFSRNFTSLICPILKP
ncbi:unnamed protein product [Caenorhabditis nigoni]